jgi:hypothetical protein
LAWRRSGRLVRWPVSRRLRSARWMIAQARVVGWRPWLSLFSSTTTLAPKVAYSSSRRTHSYSSAGDRSRAGRAPGLRATNTGSRVGVAGWLLRWWAAAMARCRTASGLRVGMPRPWRPKALRSDGQVVPNSAAAGLTLPSCSASWKARSASARSVRKRLGCQPTRRSACRLSLVVVGTGLSRAAGRVIATDLDNPDFCALAEACGAAGEAVTGPEAFGDALDRALGAGRPALLDLHVDPEWIAPGLSLSALRRQ